MALFQEGPLQQSKLFMIDCDVIRRLESGNGVGK